MARAAKAVAGVYERDKGSGIWHVRYKVKGQTVRKVIGTRQQAIDYIDKVKLLRRTGAGILPTTAKRAVRSFDELAQAGGTITVAELCDQYLAHIQDEKNPERPRDQVNPPVRVKAIEAAFGERLAGSLKGHEIKDWLVHQVGGAPATLNRYKSTFSAVYRYAKERGQVETNPVRDTQQFKVTLPPPRYLKPDEEQRLYAALQRWIQDCPASHAFERLALRCHPLEIDVAIGTGLRKSNQYDLRWEWIDFPAGLIRIPKSKNGDAITLPMIKRVRRALVELQSIQSEMVTLRQKATFQQAPVRMVQDGRVFVIRENRTWFAKALKDAKIKGLRWHDLRHTTASLMAQAGVSLKAIQEALAHKSIATTSRYAHMNKATLLEAMSVLD